MRFKLGRVSLAAFLLCLVASNVHAQSPVIRVEEDWELHIVAPDVQLNSPQITTTMMPFGSSSTLYFQLHLNHASVPEYSSGGFQVSAFSDTTCVDQQRFLENENLSEQSEQLRWTQVLIQDAQGLHFGIVAGQGNSWGQFGGGNSFVHVATSTGTLASYNVQHSAENSGATYASNRVERLRLNKVRLFLATGDVIEYSVNLDAH